MVSLTYFFLAFVALAEAGKLHGRAATCIGDAIAATGCSSTHSHCICSSQYFMSTVVECVSQGCGHDEQQAALSFAEDFCNSVKHTKRQAGGRGRLGNGNGQGQPPAFPGQPGNGGPGNGGPPFVPGRPGFPNRPGPPRPSPTVF